MFRWFSLRLPEVLSSFFYFIPLPNVVNNRFARMRFFDAGLLVVCWIVSHILLALLVLFDIKLRIQIEFVLPRFMTIP